MPPRHVSEADVYASHMQFYVADADAEPRTDVVWDGAGLERRLGAVDGLVAVGTVGYCDVPVRIEVWDEEPPRDLDDWDHVAEASLDLASGRLGLGGVEGPAGLEPTALAAGPYRLRSSAAGLADADEMDGGDRYRVQLWPAPSAEPRVLKWWPAWDPSGTVPHPTGGGRLLVGAEAEDARTSMGWLASAGQAHLFRDEGTLWEHTNLRDDRGTPQLEELDEAEAERRYGSRDDWGRIRPVRPKARHVVRDLWTALRSRRA